MVKLGSYGSCSAWQGELALDVVTAHLIAPYAKILISATPADSEGTEDAASQVAPPGMMEALEQISSHHLANVISISDGTGETTYSSGKAEILPQDPGELRTCQPGPLRRARPAGARDGIADVVSGNDSAETPAGKAIVPGFTATKGFDVAIGWGTLYAPRFVPSLVAATRADNQDIAVRRQAQRELSALEHSIGLSRTDVPAGGTSYLLAAGFLPAHPVQLLIGDRPIATLRANSLGAVTYMIDPALLHPAGRQAQRRAEEPAADRYEKLHQRLRSAARGSGAQAGPAPAL
jgi:hypothetical protein